jgi:hypothetical protein
VILWVPPVTSTFDGFYSGTKTIRIWLYLNRVLVPSICGGRLPKGR